MAKTTRRMLRESQLVLTSEEAGRRRRVAAERSGGTARKRSVRITIGKRMMSSGGLSKGGEECHERRWGMVVVRVEETSVCEVRFVLYSISISCFVFGNFSGTGTT